MTDDRPILALYGGAATLPIGVTLTFGGYSRWATMEPRLVTVGVRLRTTGEPFHRMLADGIPADLSPVPPADGREWMVHLDDATAAELLVLYELRDHGAMQALAEQVIGEAARRYRESGGE